MKWFGFWLFLAIVFVAAFLDPDRVRMMFEGGGKVIALVVLFLMVMVL